MGYIFKAKSVKGHCEVAHKDERELLQFLFPTATVTDSMGDLVFERLVGKFGTQVGHPEFIEAEDGTEYGISAEEAPFSGVEFQEFHTNGFRRISRGGRSAGAVRGSLGNETSDRYELDVFNDSGSLVETLVYNGGLANEAVKEAAAKGMLKKYVNSLSDVELPSGTFLFREHPHYAVRHFDGCGCGLKIKRSDAHKIVRAEKIEEIDEIGETYFIQIYECEGQETG